MQITRRTKIVATLGPSSANAEMIRRLIHTGVNVFRINMSHTSHERLKLLVPMIREIASSMGTHLSILMDLQGPKIRVGEFESSRIELTEGQRFVFDQNPQKGDQKRVNTAYETIHRDVKSGDRILLDDGKLEVKVLEVCEKEKEVITEVVIGGILSDHKGMNLPGVHVNLPALTRKDLQDVREGCLLDVDYLALSFVQKAQDVFFLRKVIQQEKNSHIRIVSKIEKPVAVEEIDAIIEASDVIMIARGDLGVEISPEKVPMVQKKIISKCNKRGVPVITATQMLDSMASNPKPTRAEASDVANAILDGTDAVMLSGETAAGKYPLESVDMMHRIIVETEREIGFDIKPYSYFERKEENTADAISYSACQIARALGAKAICAFTSGGNQPWRVARFRPDQPVIGVTYDPGIANRISLFWGVFPILIQENDLLDDEILQSEDQLIRLGLAKEGDKVVVVAGIPMHIPGSTNILRVHHVSDISTLEKSYRF